MTGLERFTKSERAAHWLIAAAFAVMLASGGLVPRDWTWTTPALDVHVGAAIVLVGGLAGIVVLGNGAALLGTARDLRRLDTGDRAWLRPGRILRRGPAPPVGRLNAGQKLNGRLSLVGLCGLYASGLFLLAGAGPLLGDLHGPLAFLTTALIAGHVFMSVVNPSTRHALREMTLGTVDRAWARHHFPRWVEELERRERAASAEDGRGSRR